MTNILSMLDAQQITLQFLETKLQVHPDVVRYIQEQDEAGSHRTNHRAGPGRHYRSIVKTYSRHECNKGWHQVPDRSFC